MRKKMMVRAAALALALALAVPALPGAEAARFEADPVVRVGLFYGGSALDGANLLNKVGSGYRFGYFDNDLEFQELGWTGETAISMVKDQTVSYATVDNWAGYYDDQSSSITVGGWHLQLSQSYARFEDASSAASMLPGGFPAWVDGAWYVRVGAYPDSFSAQSAQTALGLWDAAVVGESPTAVSVVKTGTTTVLFQFDSTMGLSLGVMPGLDDATKAQTIFRGKTYFGGFQYKRSGGDLTVINVLPMDDYIQGVIVQEMSPSWPLEALKAQAVCARSYAYGKLQAGKHQSQGFDLCNTVDCQAHVGVATMNDNTYRAVEETSGEYLWYGGEIATQAVYFSHDGGATESAENVWGNSFPYLVGKPDPYEASVSHKISNYNWSVTYTAQELTDLLNKSGRQNAGVVDCYVSKTSPTGSVLELTFVDAAGKRWSVIRESCRTLLGLRSMHYTVSGGSGGTGYGLSGGGVLPTLGGTYAIDGSGATAPLTEGQVYVIDGSGTVSQAAPSATASTGSGSFTFTGSGWGHSVGMSQWGAYAMAEQGYGYDEILSFYYTGIEVRQP